MCLNVCPLLYPFTLSTYSKNQERELAITSFPVTSRLGGHIQCGKHLRGTERTGELFWAQKTLLKILPFTCPTTICCVMFIVSLTGSRCPLGTARYHLNYQWRYRYHWLRNTNLELHSTGRMALRISIYHFSIKCNSHSNLHTTNMNKHP